MGRGNAFAASAATAVVDAARWQITCPSFPFSFSFILFVSVITATAAAFSSSVCCCLSVFALRLSSIGILIRRPLLSCCVLRILLLTFSFPH